MRGEGSSLFPRQFVRGLTAFTLILIGLAHTTGDAAAQASGIDGNTFTGEIFEWTVTWDEDVWDVADLTDAEDSDFLQLASVEGQPFGFANILAVSAYDGDPAVCAENFVDDVLTSESVSNVREATGVDLPRAPRGWQNAAFSYTSTGESGPFDFIDYVECRTLVEDEAVLLAWMTTVEEDFDGAVVNFGDLLDGIEISEDAETSGAETPGPKDPEETSASDGGGSAAGPGIDGNAYTSPTYGYTVEWNPDVWTTDPQWEIVDYGSTHQDRLSLYAVINEPEGQDAYVDFVAQTAYDGDPVDCLDGEVELLSEEKGVITFEPIEDRTGEPMAGTSDGGGAFAVYSVTSDADGDGNAFESVFYVECRTLVEDEAVLFILLTAPPDVFQEAFELAQEVIDTFELSDEP